MTASADLPLQLSHSERSLLRIFSTDFLLGLINSFHPVLVV